MDIPFMFAFRVLYNIGVIYLLVGSLQVKWCFNYSFSLTS
jgi:hypothetical protein